MLMFEVSGILVRDEAHSRTGVLELRGWAEDKQHQNSKGRRGQCVWRRGGKKLELRGQVIRLPKPELSEFLKPGARARCLSGQG